MPTPIDPWLWHESPVPYSRDATPIRVARYNPDGAGEKLEELDNVECLEIDQRIGTDPGRCTLRYRFTEMDESAPQSIEEALSSDGTLPKTIAANDQIVVIATRPDGTDEFIFHGRTLEFHLNLGHSEEDVGIGGVGIAKECWDKTVGGIYMRDNSALASGDDFQSDIPAQFNAKKQPTATPEASMVNADDSGETDQKYPTWLDPSFVHDPDVRRKWDLAMAARYLIFRHIGDTPSVKGPDGATLDALLVAKEPTDGASFDPSDASTFTPKPIIVSDRPFTGRDWPSVLNEFIRDKGFGMAWDVGNGDEHPDEPTTTLRLFTLQQGELKDVYLQERGETLDPELSNVGEASVGRDVTQVINEWRVIGALERYEVSVVLAPGFGMVATDDDDIASIDKYSHNNADFDAGSDAYRLFVFDEVGQGHYANGTNTKLTTVTSLDQVLGDPDEEETAAYATRNRKPVGETISTDAAKKPYGYRVAVSTDYTGTYPAVWDRSAHWQDVDAGHKLLKDRIGIRLTVNNPNEWKCDKSQDTNAAYPNGIIKVVESLATTTNAQNKPFFVRLTCCIDGDKSVEGKAERTETSVLPNTIARTIDARDRFVKWTVSESSEFNDGGDEIITRDDSDDCKAEAIANRVASESGILEGHITIPRFTRYYRIGDRISKINGRNLGFRTDNSGGSNPNTAIYPVVTSIRHILKGGQKTIVGISDQDGHRHKIESKIKRH